MKKMKSEIEPIVFKSFRTPGLTGGKKKKAVRERTVIFCSSRLAEEIDLFNSALGGFDGCGFISALVRKVISETQIYIGLCQKLSRASE